MKRMQPGEYVIYQTDEAQLTDYNLDLLANKRFMAGGLAGTMIGGVLGGLIVGAARGGDKGQKASIPLDNIAEIKKDSEGAITVVQKWGDDYMFFPKNSYEWHQRLTDIVDISHGEASSFSGRCVVCDAVLTSAICKKCGHHN